MKTLLALALLALALLALALLAAPSAQAAPFVLTGTGQQIYGCGQRGGAWAWTLTAPAAVLTDKEGREVGRHFAGPSWRAADGSTVTGEVLAADPAPSPGAIPWLVLRAASHEGAGAFARVSYIVRSDTVGGVAPATGCDAAHDGAEARIDYQATYTLFGG